jgi:hypothetical protein
MGWGMYGCGENKKAQSLRVQTTATDNLKY